MHKPLHDWTPTFHSMPLSHVTGKDIYLKMECFQPAGSFKIRGLGRLCQHHADEGVQHFVSSSGGNAGLAVAYAGRKLGIKTTVFIPSTSKQIYIRGIELEGADVVVAGDVWDETDEAAREFCDKVQGGFVPPFDHPIIWEGHASMITETAADGIKPDAVVVAVGGGGLASGVLAGMHEHGWQDVPLFAVETEGAASFAASVAAGEVVTLPEINTVATSLGAKHICQNLFDWTAKHSITPLVVSDEQACAACRTFADDHRVLIEVASGAPLWVVYEQYDELAPYQQVLVIVCGGVGCDLSTINSY